MKCYVCHSPDMFSVNDTGFFGDRIKYVAHTGFGIELLGCRNCDFISAEFIHPKTLTRFYETPAQKTNTATLHRLHDSNCRKQADFFTSNLPKKTGRVLFFGAGRSLHAQPYMGMSDELFICDLVPAFRDLTGTSIRAKILDDTQLKDDDLAGSFDLIVLSNVLQRLPFPRSQISLCSRLLKHGGHLAFETPITTLNEVREGRFGREEVNFFSANTLKAIISTQGSFGVELFNIDDLPRDDPSAMGIGEFQSLPRKTAQYVLVNERPVSDLPPSDIAPEDIISVIGKLSFGCFVAGMSMSTWSDGRPIKRPVVVLDPGEHN